MQRVLSLVALGISLSIQAQELFLDRTMDLAGSADRAIGIKPFQGGGYLLFSNQMDEIGSWQYAPVVSRLDYDGTVIWDHLIEPEEDDFGSQISAFGGFDHLPDHGYVVAGVASGLDSTTRGLVVRLDASGNELWRRSIVDGSGIVMSTMVRFTRDGGCYVRSISIHDALQYSWMSKFSANGTLIWERIVEPSGLESWSSGFCVEEDGGFTTVGALRQAGGSVPWIGRFDAFGELIWERTFEMPGLYMNFHLIEKDPSAGYYVQGSDYITVYTNLDSGRDAIAHIDTSGNMDWLRMIGTHSRTTRSRGFELFGELGIVTFGYTAESGAGPGERWRARFTAINSLGDSLTTVDIVHQDEATGLVHSTWIYDLLLDCASERVIAVGGVQGALMQNWTTDEDRWLYMVDANDHYSQVCTQPLTPEQSEGLQPLAYPNPLRIGDALIVQVPGGEEQMTSLEIVALDGRIMSIDSWRVLDDQTFEMRSPIKVPGVYYVRAVHDGSIREVGKVLVLE